MIKTTKQKEIEELKRKARELSVLGFTCREIADKIPRSRTWIAKVVKEGQGLDKGL